MAISNRFFALFTAAVALAISVSVAAPVRAATVTVLYNFADGPGGEGPFGLMQAADGYLYGAAAHGGANDSGVVYRITYSGNQTPIYAFTAPDANGNNADGANPSGTLYQASDGTLYGTAYFGGTGASGTVFRMTTAGALTTLHSFTGSDGAHPFGGVIQASDGNFYGTTNSGGASGKGTVFQMTPSGTLTTLHSFTGSDGAGASSLIQASDGYLYGVTGSGGSSNVGTVFRITTSGTLTTLYTFTGGTDGATPFGPLVQATDGYLYGEALFGGIGNQGTIFHITTSGTLTTVYTFTGGSDESLPIGGLIQCADGNFYGTTHGNGSSTHGTVFQVTPAGALTTLHTFTGSDGDKTYTGLMQADDGNLYGTTTYGGQDNYGVVFRVTGVYAPPLLTSLMPSSIDAGGPVFTLTVRGSAFQPFSTVDWNGVPLKTAYVSSSRLQAAVPANLIAKPGKVSVTVVTAAGGGTSSARTLTILLTTLKLTAATLTRNATTGVYTANVTIKNIGHKTAANTTLTSTTLGTAATSTALPVALGTVPAGATASASLSYPASAGSPGSVVMLKIMGTFTGGRFSGALKVTLP